MRINRLLSIALLASAAPAWAKANTLLARSGDWVTERHTTSGGTDVCTLTATTMSGIFGLTHPGLESYLLVGVASITSPWRFGGKMVEMSMQVDQQDPWRAMAKSDERGTLTVRMDLNQGAALIRELNKGVTLKVNAKGTRDGLTFDLAGGRNAMQPFVNCIVEQSKG